MSSTRGPISIEVNGVDKVIVDKFGRVYAHQDPGTVFFVDSVNGADSSSNDGRSWNSAFATLAKALTKCTADKGDIIYLAPGHNEGISAAAGIAVNVDGVKVIGVGQGSLRPTFDFDAQAASFTVNANDVLIANCIFRCSANAITVGMDIITTKVNTKILGCEFGQAETATDEFAIALRVNAGCDNAHIEGCLFNAGAQAAVTAISITGASDNVVIRDNRFLGAHSTACINGITTLSTNVLIEKNLFYQGATEPAIELLTGTTGIIRDNDIKTNLATMAASIVADATYLFRNYYNEDVNPGTGAQIGTASADD